ncbi:MAG: hypothetical protein KC420_18970, partial [Myxococcales bacterium]|nr:hypothetical protein [Myxococcales bacterium]
YASDDPGQSSPAGDLPAPESGAIEGQDPLLVGPPGDLHIAPQSPAIAAGSAHPALGGDAEGACYGDPPDIGAFAAP